MHVALEPGVLVAGKYRIERILGQGGMGVVAAAHHTQLEQRVALKLMLPHAMSNPESVSRFIREARAAARISSEHVARVFDVGTLETGEPYIAMEYLEGQDVSQLLSQSHKLAPQDAIEYLLQACEALAEAHAAGIVHRDLKPGNLFLVHRRDGQRIIKVLDFGISKMPSAGADGNAPMTRTSALMGSPLYMSPEQMGSSKAVDARSDIWALGVVLYEMLSGQPPFNGETLPQVCAMVITEPPPLLAERAPGLPPALYEIVHRCLEKQPAARFQSVAELAQALEPLASLRGRQSVERISRVQGIEPLSRTALLLAPAGGPLPAVQAATAPTPEPPAGTHAAWGETRGPTPPKRSAAPIVVGVGIAVLGIAAAVWLNRSSATAGPAEASVASAPAVSTLAAASLVEPAAAPSSSSIAGHSEPSAPSPPSASASAAPVAAARPARPSAPPPRRAPKEAPPATAAAPAAAPVAAPKPAAPAPPTVVPPATAAPAPTRSRL